MKLQLSEIYLVFIRKLFRHKQIYAYFDYNSNGKITHNQFLEGISNLGISLEQSMETRIINYLDKYTTCSAGYMHLLLLDPEGQLFLKLNTHMPSSFGYQKHAFELRSHVEEYLSDKMGSNNCLFWDFHH